MAMDTEGAEPLPRPAFFDLAEQTPLVVLDGMVHFLLDNETSPAPCYLFEGLPFSLIPYMRLREVEEQYFANCAGPMEHWKTAFLRRTIDHRIESAHELKRRAQDADILNWLLTDLVPTLREVHLDRGQVEQAHERQRQALLQALLPRVTPPGPAQASRLLRLIGRYALILDDRVWPLVRTGARSDADLVVQARRAAFTLGSPCRLLQAIEGMFMARIDEYLRRQALSEVPEWERILQAVDASTQQIAASIQNVPGLLRPEVDCELYRDSEFGVFRQGGVWRVVLRVPAYAVEAPDRALYRFDSCRVAVEVRSCQPQEVIFQGSAYVLEPYEHMFVSTARRQGHICMVESGAYYEALYRLPLSQAIVHYLWDARAVLQAGFHRGNSSAPMHHIEEFSRRRISPEEARRLGLPVYPYYR